MNYELIYPLRNDFLNGYTLIVIVFLIMTIIGINLLINKYRNKPYLKVFIVMAFLMFSSKLIYTFFNLSMNYPIHQKFIKIIEENQYERVSGKVENYIPMRIDGKRDESFSVNGIYFTYNYYTITGAFNLVKSKGNPIEEGSIVQIEYYLDKEFNRNLILKLEYID